jgi:hypothetical protein
MSTQRHWLGERPVPARLEQRTRPRRGVRAPPPAFFGPETRVDAPCTGHPASVLGLAGNNAVQADDLDTAFSMRRRLGQLEAGTPSRQEVPPVAELRDAMPVLRRLLRPPPVDSALMKKK